MNLKRLLFLPLFFCLLHTFGQRAMTGSACSCNDSARILNNTAIEFHKKRCLADASEYYTKALEYAAPREASQEEKKKILRFAPRLFTTAREPFALKDVAAVKYPGSPWIAYHLFWEDDIDFPDDNDPCDHEIIWVRLNKQETEIRDYFTYFHGRILQAPKNAVAYANKGGKGPEVFVQWGKHGSMPKYWENISIRPDNKDIEYAFMKKDTPVTTLYRYNEAIYEKLTTTGRQSLQSPLAKQWPVKFNGSFTDFIRFDKKVDPRIKLQESGYLSISCLNNAVINRHFLRYNFAVKTEWPEQLCEDLAEHGTAK